MDQDSEDILARMRALVGKQLDKDAAPVMGFLRAKIKDAKEEREQQERDEN